MMAADLEGTEQADWNKRWEEGRTAWQQDDVNIYLRKYLKQLTNDKSGVSILVTWCGKSLDLPWLCEKGYNVVGVELSEVAAKKLFEEQNIPHTISVEGDFKVYKATDRKLKYFVGDFYKLTRELTGTFEAVWDHNALGAAQPRDRTQYVEKLRHFLKPSGRILVVNYIGLGERDTAPFSVPTSLIKQLFQEYFDIEVFETAPGHYQHNGQPAQLVVHLLSSKT